MQKELDSMQQRYDELSALFKRLYGDNVLGQVTSEQFRILSTDYNAKPQNLSVIIPAKEEQLEKLKKPQPPMWTPSLRRPKDTPPLTN